MTLTVESWTGTRIAQQIEALAALRITVFRDFPYLYDGDKAYEATYLQTYVRSPASVVVAVRDGDTVVGAATALPLRDETEDVIAPFRTAGLNLDEIFYFGESVLLSAYRGRGLGHRFFDGREAQARKHGAKFAYFCAVVRPSDHPHRPPGYRRLDDFWRARGYAPVPDLVSQFTWRDLDEAKASTKSMTYWRRAL